MADIKLELYNSLTPDEKHILNVAALKAFDISLYTIGGIISLKTKLTDKAIRASLTKFTELGFLTIDILKSVRISPEFMISIYPLLNDYGSEWRMIKHDGRFYYGDKSFKNFSEFLYSLLFDKVSLADAEKAFLEKGFDVFSKYLEVIFSNEIYKPKLSLLSNGFVNGLLKSKIDSSLHNLLPLRGVADQVSTLQSQLLSDISGIESFLAGYTALYLGDFEKGRNTFADPKSANICFFSGVEALLKGNPSLSVVEFEKGLKFQRAIFRTRVLPLLPEMALYYLTALLCIAPEESSPIFKKLLSSLEKRCFSSMEIIFKAICYYALNERVRLNDVKTIIDRSLSFKDLDYSGLLNIIVLYLVDKQPDDKAIEACYDVVKKGYTNGYHLQAYEASYCLFQWSDDLKIKKLYDEIAANFSFPTAVSQISRQEDWEKSLNAFLTLDGPKAVANSKEDSKNRIAYLFDYQYNTIQPILQTRSKAGWSAGRNIALKTFKQGGIEGMTEQDMRIASRVEIERGGYYGGTDYTLPNDIIKDLVGHPLVFLMGTTDVLVELIAAQPILQVVKTGRGYALKCDVDFTMEKLVVVKETNTRYKIYDLTNKQLAIIRALQLEKVVVPEKGRDKLMQVLSKFSSHLTVHSDLIVSENSNVRNVETDSRIRVQLLPMGDGLKAELFAKPFGSHPPYCKPGKGGKTLIYNEKGEQLQVLRELDQEKEYANEIMAELQALDSYEICDGVIEFIDPLDSLNMLDILANHSNISVVEWPEGERFKIKGSASFGNLKFNVKSKTGWFDLQGELTVNESTIISIQELLKLTAKSKNRFVELKDGEFLALSDQFKKQLEELRTFSTETKEGLQINKFASVALTDFFDDVKELKTDKAWNDFHARIDKVQKADVEVPSNLQAELRPYQEEGFRWLARLAEWEGGACLADDMGLGKTLQTLAILLHRAKEGAALVICPVSVVPNWISEIAKFAPTLTVKTLTSGNREQVLQSLEAGDLLITSYGILQSEEEALSKITFATIVLDEAHTIKNFTTKTSKAAMQLQAPFRVALTGTPIQNHLGEVWNLFNFINPGLLGTLKHFTDTFIKSDNELARKHLKKLIAPFILRRLKSAVLDELPPKTEIVKKIELSAQETAYYEALRRQAIINMEKDDSAIGTKHLKALAEITRLRQACCNVALIDPTLNIGSSKLTAFLEIVDELIENKHRALVFSQFVTHLALVRAALDKLGIKYQYLDGSTPMNEREQSVKKFQGGDGELFLISLKAGGLGLNLTSADYVIHLDPWWNPAIEDQASDRAHRFGQAKPVTIYRLVAENTIEEKIIQLHNTKRDLAESLLEGSDQSAKLSINQLVDLIKDRN